MASHRASGGDGVGWVLKRTDRLLRPATALFLVLPLVSLAAMAAGVNSQLVGLTVVGPYPVAMVGHNTAPPTLALAITQIALILALTPAANRWLRRTGPWRVVVAVNAVILTVFLWHMTAAAIAAALLYPTGVLRQPPPQSAAWVLWRAPWIAVCILALVVLVALFARIELRGTRPRSVERDLWRDGATVGGSVAVVAGLLLVAVAGPGYHGPTGLPWRGGALVPVRRRCAARRTTSLIACGQVNGTRTPSKIIPTAARDGSE
ncbi:hypothetical protein B0I32_13150 [Nonomuraea fuscirosea]|uniref:Integral membrane protein n=1 Tax=Nonomuraea fuscirosea TaxID=1291556 RepID=A0A2T0M5K8_9ACTN|nr:hypothetical protein [Nonomuraea fuscirosea]PRX52653.1 hypothetical protein B0I32_13150 [Nonomuraea fuscirosea]